jgi:hypothetical protein
MFGYLFIYLNFGFLDWTIWESFQVEGETHKAGLDGAVASYIW